MPFDEQQITIAGLLEISLRAAGGQAARTIRLTDGGFVTFNGQQFRSRDATFGTIGAIEAIDEQIGDLAPGGTITFLPATGAAAAALSQPGYQLSPMRFWLVQVDPGTGTVVNGSATLVADALLDRTRLRFGRGTRTLEIEMVSAADRLMTINEGNSLSDRFHASVWPGEAGFANAVDVGITVAWRVAAPPRGSVYGGGGGGGDGLRTFEQMSAF